MYKNRRWIHRTDILKSRYYSSVTVPHTSVPTEWAGDMTQWPDVSYIDMKVSMAENYAVPKAQRHTTTCTVTKHRKYCCRNAASLYF